MSYTIVNKADAVASRRRWHVWAKLRPNNLQLCRW